MTDKKKPTLTVVSDKSNPPTSGAGNTGTNTGAKTTRGKPYKGQPKAGSVKTPVNSEGLTVKQEAFCIAILNGTGWSDAYREAYDAENMAPATVHREAYALATNPKIAARLERAEREKQQEQRMQRLSRAERVVQKLEQIALREGDTDGTQVRALELLGKTLGLFVDRVETEDKTQRDAETVRAELEARLNRLIG
jgi:phage terminase small subunit